MKYVILYTSIVAAWFVTVIPALAHVKWFVNTDAVIEASHNIPFYNVTSIEVLTWTFVTILAVLAFGVLDSYIPSPKKLLRFGYHHEKGIVYTAQAILGLFLITVALIWNIVLIPEIPVHDSLTSILQNIEIVIGVMFLLRIYPRIASGILAILWLMIGYMYEPIALLENAMLLSLAVFFFIKNSPSDSWWNRCDKHAVEIVRIGTAISLIVLAFTEKLMYPELGMAFLQEHHWNFMSGIFPFFTDTLFVLSTGFAELIFGLVFIFGYLTRINTILISVFFALSVVTMAVQFGAWEVEDLVVYSAAILFIFYGHGKTKFFHAWFPGSWIHKRVIGKHNGI